MNCVKLPFLLFPGGSVEQLQKQLSSVMSKNEDYRQLNIDKDQQRDRDKVRYTLSETSLLNME